MASKYPDQSHRWIARSSKKSECARCGSSREVLDDGAVFFFDARGQRWREAPACVSPSGDSATRSSEARP